MDYKQSREYQDTYYKPMQEAYVDVLDEATKYFDAPPEKVAEFLETMKVRYKPQDVDSKWWSSDVIGSMKKADDATRQKVLSKVADLLKLQDRHDKALDQHRPESYQKWRQEQTVSQSGLRFSNCEVESQRQTSSISNGAVTNRRVHDQEKRIKAHNERLRTWRKV